MKNFINYLKNVRAELTHVVWPSPRQAAVHTVIILAISAFTAVFIGVLDYAFTSVVGSVIAQ